MDQGVIDAIIASVQAKQQTVVSEGAVPLFFGKGYTTFPLKKDNFVPFSVEKDSAKTAFVDGGNSELFASPDLSLQFVRVYGTIYRHNKRLQSLTQEYYVLVHTQQQGEDKGLHFVVDLFHQDGRVEKGRFSFNTEDKQFTEGNFRLKIGSVGNYVRDLLELEHALLVAKELDERDVLVRDGLLQCNYAFAWPYFQRLFDHVVEKKLYLVGFAKTTTLFASNGISVAANLAKLQSENMKMWYYDNLVESNNPMHPAHVYFTKLHERSSYVFRVELYKNLACTWCSLVKPLALLAENSMDPVFLGYPYGLVEADKLARVTNQEKEYLKTIFASKAGETWKALLPSLNAVNAHGVLDKLG